MVNYIQKKGSIILYRFHTHVNLWFIHMVMQQGRDFNSTHSYWIKIHYNKRPWDGAFVVLTAPIKIFQLMPFFSTISCEFHEHP